MSRRGRHGRIPHPQPAPRPSRPAGAAAGPAAAPAVNARGGLPAGVPSRPSEVALEPPAPAGAVRLADASTPAMGSSPAPVTVAGDGERQHLRPLALPPALRQDPEPTERMPEPRDEVPRVD